MLLLEGTQKNFKNLVILQHRWQFWVVIHIFFKIFYSGNMEFLGRKIQNGKKQINERFSIRQNLVRKQNLSESKIISLQKLHTKWKLSFCVQKLKLKTQRLMPFPNTSVALFGREVVQILFCLSQGFSQNHTWGTKFHTTLFVFSNYRWF